MFQVLYNSSRQSTPKFGYWKVFRIKEVYLLFIIASIRSINSDLNYSLRLSGLYLPDQDGYLYYVTGGAVSLLVIALLSDLIYKEPKKWIPCTVWVTITVFYQAILLIYSLFRPIDNAWYWAFMIGLIENCCIFYF